MSTKHVAGLGGKRVSPPMPRRASASSRRVPRAAKRQPRRAFRPAKPRRQARNNADELVRKGPARQNLSRNGTGSNNGPDMMNSSADGDRRFWARPRLERAAELLQAGDLGTAGALFREVLDHVPGHPDAEHLLGVIACLQGNPSGGALHIRRAVAAADRVPLYHANLARALKDEGKLRDAAQSFQRALELQPDAVDVLRELAELQAQLGQVGDAITGLRHAAKLAPFAAPVLLDLGNALMQAGQTGEALGAFDAALQTDPAFAQAHVNRGNALAVRGQLEEALAAYQRAGEIAPDLFEAALNGALVLNRLKRPAEAHDCARRAIDLAPRATPARFQLAQALRELRRYGEAAKAYQTVVDLDPDDPQGYHYLGFSLYQLGRLDEAYASLLQAVERVPFAPDSQRFLGLIEMAWGEPESAAERMRSTLSEDPGHAELCANFAYCLNLCPDATPADILQAHLAYEAIVRSGLPMFPRNDWTWDGLRPLRIGYVSPDFRAHSVAFFIAPVVHRHDRSRVEVYCYHLQMETDTVTERLGSLSDHWRACGGLDDEQLAQVIREDGIDLLVDLAGHTRDARPALFARKPAPRQALYLGYPTTMGLTANDFRITDVLVDPAGHEDCSRETLLRLDGSYFCFRPGETPPVAPLAADRNGSVTFGSFNNLVKLNEKTIALWAELLSRVEGSRLLLKAAALADAAVRERITRRFERHGLDPRRLKLEGHTPTMAEHLARYADVDIALDTFPYNGATTTCQALWMGVPVVSLVGPTHAGRMGLSILTAAGLEELLASEPAEYVGVAAALAQDRTRLRALRTRLRPCLCASQLMDETAYVSAMERLILQACSTPPVAEGPEHVSSARRAAI